MITSRILVKRKISVTYSIKASSTGQKFIRSQIRQNRARKADAQTDLGPDTRPDSTPRQKKKDRNLMRPRELVVAWVDAFNRGNADEMAAFYAEGAINHQVVRKPVEGRAAIRETIFSRMVRGQFLSGETRSDYVDAASSVSRTTKSSSNAAIGTSSRSSERMACRSMRQFRRLAAPGCRSRSSAP